MRRRFPRCECPRLRAHAAMIRWISLCTAATTTNCSSPCLVESGEAFPAPSMESPSRPSAKSLGNVLWCSWMKWDAKYRFQTLGGIPFAILVSAGFHGCSLQSPERDKTVRRGNYPGETPDVVAGAADVFVGGVTTGGFSLGAAGSSVSGAVSGVSTLT